MTSTREAILSFVRAFEEYARGNKERLDRIDACTQPKKPKPSSFLKS